MPLLYVPQTTGSLLESQFDLSLISSTGENEDCNPEMTYTALFMFQFHNQILLAIFSFCLFIHLVSNIHIIPGQTIISISSAQPKLEASSTPKSSLKTHNKV